DPLFSRLLRVPLATPASPAQSPLAVPRSIAFRAARPGSSPAPGVPRRGSAGNRQSAGSGGASRRRDRASAVRAALSASTRHDSQAPARPKHAMNLAEDSWDVGVVEELERKADEGGIEGLIGESKLPGVTDRQLDHICDPFVAQAFTGHLEHPFGNVDAKDLP